MQRAGHLCELLLMGTGARSSLLPPCPALSLTLASQRGHLWGPPPSWSPSTPISGTEADLVIPEPLSLPKHLIIQSGPKGVWTHLFLALEAEWKGWSMCLRSQGRCKGAWFVSLTFGSEVRYVLPNWQYPPCQGNYKTIVNSLEGCTARERGDQRLGGKKSIALIVKKGKNRQNSRTDS